MISITFQLQSVFWCLILWLSIGGVLDKIIRMLVGSCDEMYLEKELADRSKAVPLSNVCSGWVPYFITNPVINDILSFTFYTIRDIRMIDITFILMY